VSAAGVFAIGGQGEINREMQRSGREFTGRSGDQGGKLNKEESQTGRKAKQGGQGDQEENQSILPELPDLAVTFFP
jgi:hypothetical protein